MLKSILMVWVLAHNLALTQEAYEDYLGYRSVDAGVMSAELAAAIDRPELADRRFVTMIAALGSTGGTPSRRGRRFRLCAHEAGWGGARLSCW